MNISVIRSGLRIFSLAAMLLFLLSSTGPACPDGTCPEDILITALGAPTKTARASGAYTGTSRWIENSVPTADDVVLIPAGITITVNNLNPVAKSIIVRGTLNFSTTANTQLRVETIVVDGGSLIVGDATNPIPGSKTAKILIRDDLPVTQDANRLARGIVATPTALVRMISAAPRAPFVAFSGNVDPNNNGNLPTVDAVPANWAVGDQIVLPATVFTRQWEPDGLTDNMPASGTSRLQNEVCSISAISKAYPYGLTISSSTPHLFAHDRVVYTNAPGETFLEPRVHAANLTRNIIIASENTSGETDRYGHVMFMTNDVQLNGVRFDKMGRTRKRQIESDPGLDTSGYNATNIGTVLGGDNVSNPRGRYAVHFHEAGTDTVTVAQVENCVVLSTPGWGFVNHSSHVDFANNVVFDFDGAGFVAEDGDEQGSFVGNIAIGGRGNGEFSIQRTVFGNIPREDQGDMGFTGEGFWFQGPSLTVTDNIAAGCKGSGFFFWGAGRFEPTNVINGHGHFTGIPLSRPLPALAGGAPGATIKPRKWDYNGDGIPDAYVIEDFPVKSFHGNIAYACMTGLRFRFVNHTAIATFEARSLPLVANEIIPADGAPKNSKAQATRTTFDIQNCTFWNNLNGIHASYTLNGRFTNILIVAAAPRTSTFTSPIQYAGEAGVGAIGIDFHFANAQNTLTNIKVKNYTTGLWRDSDSALVPNVDSSGVTFLGCVQSIFTANVDTGQTLGDAWFDQSASTNNLPDNPQ